MRYRVLAEDFRVAEVVHLPRSAGGAYTLYRVHKVARTTLEVQAALARALGCRLAAVHFPALKDRQAVAEQYTSVRAVGPEELRGDGWVARRVGRAHRPLRSGDLRGNRFTAVLRDLAAEEVPAVGERLKLLARAGLPNYFDEQRFGSYSPGQAWVGKTILCGDAEGALRAHLGQDMAGDPPEVATFKAQVRDCWGHWEHLFDVAPRPSNFRSVLVFLRDHPAGFRQALNLVTPRVLSLYLAAFQSLLWNRTVARFLRGQGSPASEVEVAGDRLPLYAALPEGLLQEWRALSVPLPHHRAVYTGEWASLFAEVLAAERMTQDDLKARLLRRAYLGPGTRALLLFPQDAAVLEEEADERFAGRRKLSVRFSLPPGAYATMVLRALGADREPGPRSRAD
jgi:tRNA pseudouridine13 synthase